MQTTVHWPRGGESARIRCAVCGSQLRISRPKQVASPSGSFLGSELRQNKNGYLVRGDLPLQTPSARTGVVLLPGSTSPSG